MIADIHHQQSRFKKDINPLSISALIVKNLEGNVLIKLPEFQLHKDESVVLSGMSEIGNKILSGIYPYIYTMKVILNYLKLINFLSQTAYFPIGGLAHAVASPQPLLEKDLANIK